MSAAESREDRAERLTAELRAATSEAAGVLKDLTRMMREARAQVDEYAAERVAAQLDNLATQAVDLLKEQNDDFLAKFAEARDAACVEADEHLRDDWRLAVAVNEVGKHVRDALRQAMGHPIDCDCVLPIPRQVSPEYIAGKMEGHA